MELSSDNIYESRNHTFLEPLRLDVYEIDGSAYEGLAYIKSVNTDKNLVALYRGLELEHFKDYAYDYGDITSFIFKFKYYD